MTSQDPTGQDPTGIAADEPSAGAARDIALDNARASVRPQRRRVPPWVGLAVAIALLLVSAPVPYVLQRGIVTTLTIALLYAVVALGWNMLGGYGGYLNLGTAVLFGSGVYTAALLNSNLGWPMWAGIVPAVVVAALVALPVGIATLRLRGFYFAIFTLALSALAPVIVLNSGWLGTAHGIYTDAPATGSRSLAALFYLTLLGLTIIALVLSFWVEHSRFGYALRALREDEDAAAVLGVRTAEVKLRALLLGAALAGAAGAIQAFRIGYVEPFGTFDIAFSLDIVLVCVVGGMATWYGPLIGALLVMPLTDWLRTTVPDLHPFGVDIPAEANRIVLGLLLILFALYARRGVAGLFRWVRGRWLAV